MRLHTSRTNILFVVVAAACLACESATHLVATDVFAAGLSGASVKPTAVTTTGNGTLTFTLTSDTSLVEYQLVFAGLSSAATAAHIHGPAADTVVADELVDFALLPAGAKGSILLGPSGTASGTIDLRGQITTRVSGDSLFRLLHAGLLYADVHTATNTDGEIRGRLRKR